MDYQFHIVENVIRITDSLSLKELSVLLAVNRAVYVSILTKPIVSSRLLDSERVSGHLEDFLFSNPIEFVAAIRTMLSYGTIRCLWLYNLVAGRHPPLTTTPCTPSW